MAFCIIPKFSDKASGFYQFEKTVSACKTDNFTIDIFASCRYILYINEQYVCEGPCRGHEKIRYFDEVLCRLSEGENRIKVKVMHLKNGFTSVFKEEKPSLLCRLKSENECFETDSTWECYYIENHNIVYNENYWDFLPPCESVVLPLKKTLLEVEQKFSFDFTPNGSFSSNGAAYYTPMKKRPIPMIYPRESIDFKVVKSGNGFIELDAGKYITARVCAEIAPNTNMKIIYSECYEFEDGKRLRDDTNGFLRGCYDVVSTGDKDFVYETYWFRAFRYIRIETENPQNALKTIKAKRLSYPLDITGEFECSNEYYNKMVEISKNTILSCMHEIFVDCPHYEQQQYIMDSAIESNVCFCLSQDDRMVRKCIEEFAVSQRPDGSLCANYPSTYIQMIPGFSLFWIFLLRDYLEYSANVKFVKSYVGTMDKILTFFENQIDEYGCITSSPYWDFVDWVDGWNRGAVPIQNGEAITVYNMYYAYALKCAVYICEKTGRCGLARDYNVRYENFKKTINELCFDEEKGLYRDGSETATYSVHTIIWAILSEVVPKEKEKELAQHLFDEGISKCSFSMNYYLFRALEKCGMYDKTADILKGWEQMIDMHCTTWCEEPNNPRSECHAWSCAPVYEFATNILGVRFSVNDVIIIKPDTLSLDFARGTVPTRHGKVCVDWEKTSDRFKIAVQSPSGIVKRLIFPNGEEKTFADEYAEFEM